MPHLVPRHIQLCMQYCKLQVARVARITPLASSCLHGQKQGACTRLYVAAIFIQNNARTCIAFIIKPIARNTRGFAYPCDSPSITNHNIQYLYPATAVFG